MHQPWCKLCKVLLTGRQRGDARWLAMRRGRGLRTIIPIVYECCWHVMDDGIRLAPAWGSDSSAPALRIFEYFEGEILKIQMVLEAA